MFKLLSIANATLWVNSDTTHLELVLIHMVRIGFLLRKKTLGYVL